MWGTRLTSIDSRADGKKTVGTRVNGELATRFETFALHAILLSEN